MKQTELIPAIELREGEEGTIVNWRDNTQYVGHTVKRKGKDLIGNPYSWTSFFKMKLFQEYKYYYLIEIPRREKRPMPVKPGELCLAKRKDEKIWAVDRFDARCKKGPGGLMNLFSCHMAYYDMIAEYDPEIAYIEGAMPSEWWGGEEE